jgi:very-short-patch-repair endonuclease
LHLLTRDSEVHLWNSDRKAIARARRLRRSMSDSERKLWALLRRKTLGFRFRRQVPVGTYVLDFFCFEARLCVEVDGEQHGWTEAEDARRDAYLGSHGIETLRIPTLELYENAAGVLQAIYDLCCRRAGREGLSEGPLPGPPPPGEGN